MKTTYNWIKEYVPSFDGSIEEMCERFTMSGTEVEYFTRVGDDWVIEFSVTSNRVDCLGMAGLARELAAACGLEFVAPDTTIEESGGGVEEKAAVAIEDVEGCPRYTAMVIEGIAVGPSPKWMVDRLEAIGERAINNVVDVTNYVLFEMNQPFHAFDLDKLEDGKIVVRRGRPGERITALNGTEYELTPDMTAITEADRAVAIGGVMGGAETEVTEGTTNVLLETAYFDRIGIRNTSKKLNLDSASSFRFERGIDPTRTTEAARRCAKLLVEVAGGTIRPGIVDVNHHADERPTIPFRHEQVKRITGIDIPWDRCREIFERLDLEVAGDPASGITVVPPTWREDLTREIDLVEEVIRIHGLHELPMETDMRVMTVHTPHPVHVRELIQGRLVAAGFSETLTTSFVSEPEGRLCLFAETEPVTIRNAMRSDENALRQSLVPSLLRVRKTNQDHGTSDVRIAECTVVYLAKKAGEIPEHLPILGALLDDDYRAARGVIEAVAACLGIDGLGFGALDGAGQRLLESAGGATVTLGDTVVGHVGRPRADLLKRYDLKIVPYVFELRTDVLADAANLTPKFRKLSRLPGVNRDLSIIVDEATTWGDVEAQVGALELPNLESVSFFTEFRGKQVGAGKKSLHFGLVYRSDDRTLTGEEVDAAQARLVAALEEKFAAAIRK